MAQITAALVKELRDMTGAGMMECKKALVEADGDMDKAVDVLRTLGIAKAVKKAGRATNEGAVVVYICDCGAAGIAEVNCETDFVSGNEKFKAFANSIVEAGVKGGATNKDDIMDKPLGEATVHDALIEAIHIFGENMQISRFERVELSGTGAFIDYIHMGGKIGVLVEFALKNADTAKDPKFIAAGRDVAMQIAAADPVSVDRDSVDPEVVEHEKGIYKAQAAESGKNEEIQEKMATGRLQKFYKENCLVEQDFVKDSEKTVKQYLASVSKEIGDDIKPVKFLRYRLGENIEEE